MRKTLRYAVIVLLGLIVSGLYHGRAVVAPRSGGPLAGEWQPLFNGTNLDGWEVYLATPHRSVEVEGLARDADSNYTAPLGLGNDPLGVMSVVDVEGQPVIRISGQVFGALTTLKAYRNYHLSLQFRWGAKKWPPRAEAKKDSGLLYHAFGAHGGDGAWMKSQEFQIQEGDCGDYWGVGGTAMDIAAQPTGPGEDYVYTPGAPPVTFSEGLPPGRHCRRGPGHERPAGQWNTAELYTFGGTAVHVLNGEVVMVLRRSAYLGGEDAAPLTEGKIQIQSEGAEVYYRDIKIKSIEEIPAALLR